MRIYESILDDLESTDNGMAVKKLADEVNKKRDEDYDLNIIIEAEHQVEFEEVCAAALLLMRDSLSELLDADPNVDDYSDVDVCSSWPEMNKPILKHAHHVLYSRPKVSGKYEGGLQVKISYSFRRPIHALYFLGRLYNSLCVLTAWKNIALKLYKKKDDKRIEIAAPILQYIVRYRREKVWENVQADTERELIKIANFMVPCLNAYTDVAKKFDSLNFDDTSFAAEVFRAAAWNLNKKVVIPGYLYVQMLDVALTGQNILSAGKFSYFYHSMTTYSVKDTGSGETDGQNGLETWISRTMFDELDERPRKPVMIYAHVYKNIYLHLFITLSAFYDEESQTPYLFAVDFSMYILDEELIDEDVNNICNNLFGGQVSTTDFKKFLKETFPDNYAKRNTK